MLKIMKFHNIKNSNNINNNNCLNNATLTKKTPDNYREYYNSSSNRFVTRYNLLVLLKCEAIIVDNFFIL